MYNLIFMLILATTVTARLFGEVSVEHREKKSDFLKAPIFKNRRESIDNSRQWNQREQEAGSKFEKTEILPLTTNKSTLKLARPTGSPASELKARKQTMQTIPPNTLPQYSLLPKPSTAEDASECGYNSYTLNYCLYLSHKPKPVICAEKWNRCVEGYQP